MKIARSFSQTLVALACIGLIAPQLAISADLARPAGPSAPAPVAKDIVLHTGGLLVGQVVDANGVPQASVEVAIGQDGRAGKIAMTDGEGVFHLADISGGVYTIQSEEGGGLFRLWAPQTAPPAAKNAVLIVTGDELARGQFGGGGLLGWLGNPWVLAAVVAAAIAVPIALDDNSSS